MDQRISYITNLKNNIQQRNSIQSVASILPVQKESVQDPEYLFVRKQVTQSFYFNNASKHVSIRLNNWIQRLDKIQANKVWQSNRNNYIKLLNLMCHCQYLTKPFNQLPPQCDLPHLRKHQITQLIDQVQRSIKTSRLTSKRQSIHLQNVPTNKSKNVCNLQQKRFNTDSYTYGQEESDTIQMKPWNLLRNFETDLDDKTISFSQDNKFVDHLQSIDHNHSVGSNKTKILKTSCSSKQLFNDIKNNYETQPYKKQQNSAKYAKPPLHKKAYPTNIQVHKSPDLKIQRSQQYWESNAASCNHSNYDTPKYLDKCQLNESKIGINEVEIVSFRQNQNESCDCTSKMLGQGWFSQLFKKITL